jgi:iron complex transport system ATP-binding protein
MPILKVTDLTLGYQNAVIIKKLNLQLEKGTILSIIGPNGSGKSTVLRAISRNLKPWGGFIYLNGRDMQRLSSKGVARQMATLPQTPRAPGDLTVRELVGYGRFPYQKWWRKNRTEDALIVKQALQETAMTALADRPVQTLSGGELQRAWLAMALAQKPQILLLDEPTTYLDICHQLAIMQLIAALNREYRITVIMVLHDINHAAKYSHQIVVLKQGELFASGAPAEVITQKMLEAVFGVIADIWLDADGVPVCRPYGLSGQEAAAARPSISDLK